MSDIEKAHALAESLQQVVTAHGLDPESALGAIARVAATQVEAFVMGDALEASDTALSGTALLQRAREVLERFSSAVLANIAWTTRADGPR